MYFVECTQVYTLGSYRFYSTAADLREELATPPFMRGQRMGR